MDNRQELIELLELLQSCPQDAAYVASTTVGELCARVGLAIASLQQAEPDATKQIIENSERAVAVQREAMQAEPVEETTFDRQVREDWDNKLRISKSGFSVKCGDRVVAEYPGSRKQPFNAAHFQQWMEDAERLVDGWNATPQPPKVEVAGGMSEELKPCPCGKTPTLPLTIVDAGQGGKWAYVSGNCCGAWEVEFRTDYHAVGSPECHERAVEAWNEAPRHSPSDCARCAELAEEVSDLNEDVDELIKSRDSWNEGWKREWTRATELQAENAGLAKDATRYRWLRDEENGPENTDDRDPWAELGELHLGDFDNWIDAEMEGRVYDPMAIARQPAPQGESE